MVVSSSHSVPAQAGAAIAAAIAAKTAVLIISQTVCPKEIKKMESLLFTTAVVVGHGAMTFPTPRNAIDATLPPFKDWKYPCDATHKGADCKMTFCSDGENCQGACPKSAHNGQLDALTANNGQSCYWFSNGCMVGCDECDGTNNHVGHGAQSFLYNGMTASELKAKNITINPWNPPAGWCDVRNEDGSKKCKGNLHSPKFTIKPTICDPKLRTMNTQAECGGPADFYYFSPWRAPGAAPVIDVRTCNVFDGA
eukprot:gene10877-35269_t